MNVALGVLFIWLGAAALWVAFHGQNLSNPWDGFTSLISAMSAQEGS